MAHFRRSSKIIHILLTLLTRHDLNLMFNSQAMNALRELNEDITRPNQGSVTRWVGMIDIYMWIAKYWETLLRYREHEDCFENDDGTR